MQELIYSQRLGLSQHGRQSKEMKWKATCCDPSL